MLRGVPMMEAARPRHSSLAWSLPAAPPMNLGARPKMLDFGTVPADGAWDPLDDAGQLLTRGGAGVSPAA
jgi:hypothetical protein